MKHAHIVYAHPESKSFVASMRDATQQALELNGWVTSVTNLSDLNFEPTAGAADFLSRANNDYLVYPLEQRQSYKSKTLSPDILAEVEAVKRADLLVLVFPIFWYSVPAQMKGWIDRVFLSGTFYGGTRFYDRGGMKGKHAMVVASLGGRDYMFGPSSIHGDLKGMLRHLLQGTLGYVGYSVYEPFFAYHVPYVSNEERVSMLTRLHGEIERLEIRSVIPMPSMDDFDDQCRPKSTGSG